MKTKVRNSGKKRKSLKKATKNATKKATKKTTKRQKKLLNYKNRNTRKNKKGGDATLPIVGATAAVIAGAAALSYITTPNNNSGYHKFPKSNNQYKFTRNRNSPTNNTTISDSQKHNNNQIRKDEKLNSFLNKHKLVKELIPDDGNCLFTAFLKFLNTYDQDLYKNAGELPHEKPKLSHDGKKKVKELRNNMVEWMQSDDSKEGGQTFLEKYKFAITSAEPHYDPGEKQQLVAEKKPVRETMYDDLDDYVGQMTRIEPDETRKKAQFGTQIEIAALVKMYFEETDFLQLVVVGDKGSLTLHTLPDKSDVDLDSINVNMPILLLKDGHFEILKHDEKMKRKKALG